jgi:hypothetical protein
MSVVVVHLRWDIDPDRSEEVVRDLADGVLPAGCWSRQPRRQGGAVLATEVWRSEEEARDHLRGPAAPALGRPTHTAMFAIPDMFACSWTRGARPAEGPERPAGDPRPTATVLLGSLLSN